MFHLIKGLFLSTWNAKRNMIKIKQNTQKAGLRDNGPYQLSWA